MWAEPDSASHGGDGAFDMEVVAKAEAHFGGRSSTSAIPGPQSTAKATVIAAAGPSQQKEEDVEEGKPHVHPSRTIAANRASPHVHVCVPSLCAACQTCDLKRAIVILFVKSFGLYVVLSIIPVRSFIYLLSHLLTYIKTDIQIALGFIRHASAG